MGIKEMKLTNKVRRQRCDEISLKGESQDFRQDRQRHEINNVLKVLFSCARRYESYYFNKPCAVITYTE
jgi:hypothetical protein